jgi:hypothetical protein
MMARLPATRHLADHKQWLTESRERIARRRAKLA